DRRRLGGALPDDRARHGPAAGAARAPAAAAAPVGRPVGPDRPAHRHPRGRAAGARRRTAPHRTLAARRRAEPADGRGRAGRRRQAGAGPRPGGGRPGAGPGPGRRRDGTARAARGGARDPAADPSGQGARGRADRAGRRLPGAVPGVGGGAGRGAAVGGDDRVLHRGRGADERRQAQRGRARPGGVAPARRHAARRDRGRRARRGRGAGRLRAGGGPPPGGRARRGAHRDQPGRRADENRGGAAVRVVIAEDDALLREGLALLLGGEGYEVAAAVPDPESFMRAVAEHRPDVAVVDVRMPPTHTDEGIKAAVEARRLHPELAVLVLSAYVEQAFATELLAGGTNGIGYLLKERVGRVGEFVSALERVASGGTAIDPEVVAQLFTRRRGPLDRLTARELEVLALMAEGLGNTAIAERLVVTDGAVHKHIRDILANLDLSPTDRVDRRVAAVLHYLEA